MSPLVLDASIAVSWFLDDEFEPGSHYLLERLRQDEGIVPQHWHYVQIRNALLVAERRGRATILSETEDRLDSLNELPIRTDQQADLEEALRLARAHRLSFYDALYLELAKETCIHVSDLGLKPSASCRFRRP